MSHFEVEITVLGGLNVTVEGSFGGAEPDVGIFGDYVEEWYVTAIAGRPVRKADWVHNRIAKTKGEEDRVIEAIFERAH